MDRHTKIQRSNNMRAIRSKNTRIEMMLRKELWRRGLRYRVNCKSVYGKPDILFVRAKIAIFCDGDFWHGKDYNENTFSRSDNSEFWNKKIVRNMERDRNVNETLAELGYFVLRFWESEIVNNLEMCCEKICEAIYKNESNSIKRSKI